MKKIVISYNFNGWRPVATNITYSEKIKLFAKYIKGKYANLAEVAVINLQEYIGGASGKYVDELENAFSEYDVLTPPGFNYLEHYKSIMNVTLIRKEYGYKLIRIESCLPNRICYVKVWFDDTPIPLRIMNLYAVQTVCFPTSASELYINKRREQKESLWAVVQNEAKSCDEPLLILGDMQEGTKNGPHIKKLNELGFKEKNGGFFPTVNNEIFAEEQNIDHFLYSSKAWDAYYPVSFEYDGNLLDELSDHVLLAAVSA